MQMSFAYVRETVNALAAKGFVKMQSFRNSRNKLAYSYILTPGGLAEKLRTDIAGRAFLLEPPSERSRVTISAGVAMYAGDRQKLFSAADASLYRAKDEGRDCVVLAEEHDFGQADGDPEAEA